MNRQVWRDDKELMIIVNLRGIDLINSMNGKRTLIEMVDQVYSDATAGLDIIKLEDMQQFSQIDDYEARYLETASFIIKLWTKGLITLKRKNQKGENNTNNDIMNELIGSLTEIKVEQIILILEKKYGTDEALKHQMFHKVHLKLLSLLIEGQLAPQFIGTMDELTDKGNLTHSINPKFKIGYIKPTMLEAVSGTNTSKATTVGTTIACGGIIVTVGAVAEVGTTAGRTVGEWESE